MLMYKPPVEPRQNFLPTRVDMGISHGYHSVMTRQSLRALYRSLPQKHVMLPRFVPVGVYKPICDAEKTIHFFDVPNDLRIDIDTIENMHLDPADTIVHYVHQFGIHMPDNVQCLKGLQQRGFFVVDDRSLTLPVDTYEEFGDATAYSFYKLVGLPYGGQVRTKAPLSAPYIEPNEANRLLMDKMKQNFYFYANGVNTSIPSLVFRLHNRLFSRFVEYGHLVNNTLQDTLPMLPEPIRHKLSSIDFNKITQRRADIARLYYEGLRPELLLPVPLESFTHQSLMGFPILVDDPMVVLKALVRKGITTFRFTKIWWWDKSRPFNDLYNRNLLLPAHHGLSDADVHRIISCVNDIVALHTPRPS